jgi:UDP-glucose 4-epimerase
MKKNKVVITGGAGSIGTALTKLFKKKGFEVLIIDNLIKKGIPDFDSSVKISTFDISSKEWPLMLLQDLKNAKYVFHLAALTNQTESISFPHEYNKTNVSGTLHLLAAAAESDVDKFIFASELSKKKKTTNPYLIQKYMGELYCSAFTETYDLNTLSARLPLLRPDKSKRFLTIDSACNALHFLAESKGTVPGSFVNVDKKFINVNNL